MINKDAKIKMATALRILSVDTIQKANSGHPGMPLGIADVATILFSEFLKFNTEDPKWQNRDRFILSAGHGSALLYSLFYFLGYKDMTINDLKSFRQLHSRAAGHPEYNAAEAIEITTGPLGQGIANAVGMAIAEKINSAKYGQDICDHYTYVIAGDGCLMEGLSHEAISIAGHLKLNKLIVIFDDNDISIDGSTNLTVSDDQQARFKACNWDVFEVDGHNQEDIRKAISAARESSKPSLLACKTTIGHGSPNKSGTSSVHGSPLGKEEITEVRKYFNWDYPEFEFPEDVISNWRSINNLHKEKYNKWQKDLSALNKDTRDEFNRRLSKELPKNYKEVFSDLKKKFMSDKLSQATRKSSFDILNEITEHIPELLGGSADLTGSNLTKATNMKSVSPDDFSGNYIHYGVREHAMGSIMNGIASYKGFIPYGGTFLVFTDYCRPAIRLAALMKLQVIYVATHDSIGLGEDGPTHQPVEHLASLRAIPDLNIYRPADTIETLECWQLALENKTTPSVLVLTRQSIPHVREDTNIEENKSSKGAYILSEASSEFKVSIFASGSEIEIAMEAKEALEKEGIGVRVISVPCFELFNEQSSEYKVNFLCNSTVKVAVEAGCIQGWKRFIGPHGIFIGMDEFGASAPANELYKHFGITAENITEKVKIKLSNK